LVLHTSTSKQGISLHSRYYISFLRLNHDQGKQHLQRSLRFITALLAPFGRFPGHLLIRTSITLVFVDNAVNKHHYIEHHLNHSILSSAVRCSIHLPGATRRIIDTVNANTDGDDLPGSAFAHQQIWRD
jgi:hypothetical protein